jgi:hypothetical protein
VGVDDVDRGISTFLVDAAHGEGHAGIISIGFPVGAMEEESATFSKILIEQDALTFKKVKSYVEDHPDAADVETAYAWLFKTA